MITSYNFYTATDTSRIDWKRSQYEWEDSWDKTKHGFGKTIYDPVKDRIPFLVEAIGEQYDMLIRAFREGNHIDHVSLMERYDNTIKFAKPEYVAYPTILKANMVVTSSLNAAQFGHLAKKALERFELEYEGYVMFYEDHNIEKPVLVDNKGKPVFVGECIHDYQVIQVLPVGNGVKEYVKCQVCGETAYRDVKMA
jgi:hypothetical protein